MNGMKYQDGYSRMIIYLFGLDFVSLSFYDNEFNIPQNHMTLYSFDLVRNTKFFKNSYTVSLLVSGY